MANVSISEVPVRSARLSVRTGVSARFFVGLLIAICAAGALLRFFNLESRVLWGDENISVLRAAGYTEAEFARVFLDGRTHTVSEMRLFQGWGADRGVYAVARSLALEDPQHPPAFYVILHFWQRAFGASVAAQRVFSVLVGIALIPAMYWLCSALFRCKESAAIGAALIAVSPFFFAYSHELREYGLLALVSLLSQAVLLQAQRSGGIALWSAYALTIAAGLYTDLFFVSIVAANAMYFCFSARGNASVRAGGAALVCGVLLFAPWVLVLRANLTAAETMNAWSATSWPIRMLVQKWVFNAGSAFFDLEYERVWLSIILMPVLLMIGYAVIYAFRRAEQGTRYYLVSLLITTIGAFCGSDLVLHAHRSAITRYGTLSYLALLLCMAGMLGYEVSTGRRRLFAQCATMFLALCGLLSCIVASQQLVWWDNHADDEIVPIAYSVNGVHDAIIVAPTAWQRIYLLSFRLKDDVRVLFARTRAASKVQEADVFLVAPKDDAATYMRRFPFSHFIPLYLAHDSAAWQAFHRPLQKGALGSANAGKLSLWRIASAPPAGGPMNSYSYHGCGVYGPNDWFTTNLVTGGSSYATNTVDPNSASIINNFIMAHGGSVVLHINASNASVNLQDASINVANANTPLVKVTGIRYGVGNTPWNDVPDMKIPWDRSFFSQGSCRTAGGDCHSIVMTPPAGFPAGTRPCVDYETYTSAGYSFDFSAKRFVAATMAVYNLRHPFNEQMRSGGVTEASLPLLGTADIGEDAYLPAINHIAYVVLPDSGAAAKGSNGYVAPATQGAHCASYCTHALPMGARLRLNPSRYTCPSAGTNPQANKICVQLETYGMIVMDNGASAGTIDLPVGPTAFNANPWNPDDLSAISSTGGHGIQLQDFDLMTLGNVHV